MPVKAFQVRSDNSGNDKVLNIFNHPHQLLVKLHVRWTEKSGNKIWFDWLIEYDAWPRSFSGVSKFTSCTLSACKNLQHYFVDSCSGYACHYTPNSFLLCSSNMRDLHVYSNRIDGNRTVLASTNISITLNSSEKWNLPSLWRFWKCWSNPSTRMDRPVEEQKHISMKYFNKYRNPLQQICKLLVPWKLLKGFSIVFPAPWLAEVESSQKSNRMRFCKHLFAPYLFHRSRNNRRAKLRSKFWREKMFRKSHLKLLRRCSVRGTNKNSAQCQALMADIFKIVHIT